MKAKKLLLFTLLALALNAKAQTVSDFVSIPNPDDLEVDRFGNIWVNYRVSMSSGEHRLAKITPDGTITDVVIENHTLGQFGINDSLIWIAGAWGPDAFVYKYDHSGNKLDSLAMGNPTALILDPDGTWYITQNALGRLTKVNPDKTTEILASGSPLDYNLALARDESGFFYTCNLGNARVIKIDPNTGSKTILVTLPTSTPYSLGFLAYSNGHLYVPSFKNCIYKVDISGIGYSVFAGTEGASGDLNGDIDAALFNGPTSVAFSITGDTLYLTDAANNKIKMITGVANATTSISGNQKSETAFQLYPNPALETIYIELKAKNESIAKIDFITLDGKLMDSIRFSGAEHLQQYNLSLDRLPKGNYLLQITTSKGEVINSKFLKS